MRVALLWLVFAASAVAAPPNVVLFLADDLGWKDLGCQGSNVFETPAADRLASQGVRFTQAYAACPVCSPSRAALLTGKTPARVSFTGHITATGKHRYPPEGRIIPPDDNLHLPLEETTLAEALQAVGYTTASMGKWHLGGPDYWPRKQGFDLNVAGHTHGSPSSYWFPYLNPKQPWNPDMPNLEGGREGEYLTERLTDEAVRFLEAERKGPFFLYMTHYAVHTPLQAPEKLVAKYERKIERLGAKVNPVYAAMVETLDSSLGRILETLDKSGAADNTLVILTSDNGGLSDVTDNEPLRAGKGFLYEGGIRVPLIVRWPGKTHPGTTIDAPATGTDLFATIAEATGADASTAVDSRSLVPLLTGEKQSLAGDLYWYYPHYSPQAKRPGAAIRSGNWKLIEHYDPPAVELFDLSEDPGEQHDLAAAVPQVRERLLKALHHELRQAGTLMHTPNPNYKPGGAQ
ncbi:MAG: sulfatase [Bryobacterales bacterium]|nr:sulfatase [Bryobacterales bacterium]